MVEVVDEENIFVAKYDLEDRELRSDIAPGKVVSFVRWDERMNIDGEPLRPYGC